MKQANITVLRKILYAVESGGQAYGKQDYAAFAGVGENTPNEKAITIGAGQWYAGEAKRLLQLIQSKHPTDFKHLDNAGIAADLKKGWDRYGVSKSSAKGKCILAIITCPNGIKCQDMLMEDQIKEYAASITKTYGSMGDDAMMECINIIHQGGSAALKRILGKTKKPYTAKTIYAALCTDPADKSSNNQVGDYTGRQKKVYEYITKYAVTDKEEAGMIENEAINRVIGVAEEEIGYLEKKSNANLDSKTANAGNNNYTKYWRDIKPSYQGQPWCAAFVSWCLMQAFGLEKAKKLLKHWPYVYCPTLGSLFTKYADPQVGDIVIFYRSGTFAHTGIVTKVQGDRFWTIEGNTSGAFGIIANGGGVCEKSYYNSNLPGTKFCRPDWSLVKSITAAGKPIQTPATPPNTYQAQAQQHLNNFVNAGLAIDGDVGTETKKAFRKAIQSALNMDYNAGLELDGDIGDQSRAALKKVNLKKGSSGYLVTVLEIGMLMHGINPKGVECPGFFGDGLKKALGTFQAKKGLAKDYEAGYDTFMMLQK